MDAFIGMKPDININTQREMSAEEVAREEIYKKLISEIQVLEKKVAMFEQQKRTGDWRSLLHGRTSPMPNGSILAAAIMLGQAHFTSIAPDGRRVINIGSLQGLRQMHAQALERYPSETNDSAAIIKNHLSVRNKKSRGAPSFVSNCLASYTKAINDNVAVEASPSLGDHLVDFVERYQAPRCASNRQSWLHYDDWMCDPITGAPLEGVPVLPLSEDGLGSLDDVIIVVGSGTLAKIFHSATTSSAAGLLTNHIKSQLVDMGFVPLMDRKFSDFRNGALVNLADHLQSMIKTVAHKDQYFALHVPNAHLSAFRMELATYCFDLTNNFLMPACASQGDVSDHDAKLLACQGFSRALFALQMSRQNGCTWSHEIPLASLNEGREVDGISFDGFGADEMMIPFDAGVYSFLSLSLCSVYMLSC